MGRNRKGAYIRVHAKSKKKAKDKLRKLTSRSQGRLRRRIRIYIWKQWKTPKTRVANLKKLGMPNGRLIETETLEKAIGLLPEAVYYIIPLQTKDLHAGAIMIYPKHTSLCT